jgi:hypothetical protein
MRLTFRWERKLFSKDCALSIGALKGPLAFVLKRMKPSSEIGQTAMDFYSTR